MQPATTELLDNGYVGWSDFVQAMWRVTREREAMGVVLVMLEDQGRPRRCGYAGGKIVVPSISISPSSTPSCKSADRSVY